jgi:drug/metabolite transporter (DMT)-like permease
MSTQALVLWFMNMLVDTGGQLSFKKAATHGGEGDGFAHWKHMLARPWIWIGICCYMGEFLVWTAFLSLVELSVGIMLGSINIVVIMLAGRVLFGETLSPRRTAGMLLITLGVAVVGLGQ